MNTNFQPSLDIGLTLRKYRNKFNYTQQNVADSLNISRAAYKKWENNDVDFSISQLKRVAELYHVPIQQIISVSRYNANGL